MLKVSVFHESPVREVQGKADLDLSAIEGGVGDDKDGSGVAVIGKTPVVSPPS